jgi:hypothetical protein
MLAVEYLFSDGTRLKVALGGNEWNELKKREMKWLLLSFELSWKAFYKGNTVALNLSIGRKETLLFSRFLLFEKVNQWSTSSYVSLTDIEHAVTEKPVIARRANPYEKEVLRVFTGTILSVWYVLLGDAADGAHIQCESAVGAKVSG